MTRGRRVASVDARCVYTNRQPASAIRGFADRGALGPGKSPRPQSPPWIRLFRIAADDPWNVNWRYCPLPCDGCGAQVTFQANTYPRPQVIARCLLCLACGRVSVEYLRPGTTLHETPVVGEVWTPPCPAGARLGEAAFRPFWVDDIDGGHVHR